MKQHRFSNNSSLKTELATELAAKGISAVHYEKVTNGVKIEGFQINTGDEVVKPIVYYSPEESVETYVERVLQVLEQPTPQVDTATLITREKLLSDTYVCVQKKSNEDLVKRDFLNLELYVRMDVSLTGLGNEKGSIKITKQILEMAGLSEDELFSASLEGSSKRAVICSMAEALGAPEELFDQVPFYVGTYADKCHGAGIIATKEPLHRFCLEHRCKHLYLLPSSTAEMLLLDERTVEDPAELAALVNEVNTSEGIVDPTMQLDPVAYLYDDEVQEVSIAASFNRKEV